jgi:Ca2+-binding RTX toxin-like protein
MGVSRWGRLESGPFYADRLHVFYTEAGPSVNTLTRLFKRPLAVVIASVLVASSLAIVPGSGAATADPGRFPWQEPGSTASDGVAPIGVGFVLDVGDLRFILDQIRISETHAAVSSPDDPNCQALRGDGPNQMPLGDGGELLPFGLRTITGVCNNLVPGREYFGASGQTFPRMTEERYIDAEDISFDLNGPMFLPAAGAQTTYAPPFHEDMWVEDSQPRVISNLIVDQTTANPAAVAAAATVGDVIGETLEAGDIDGSGTLGDHPVECGVVMANPCPPMAPDFYNEDAFYIPNLAPDEALSAPYNSLLTFFGQFFDHGLDFTTKDGETIYMPLKEDDPLYDPMSHTNFMVLTRSSTPDGPSTNLTTPFVDQQQTYGSVPSVHVFLRQYQMADNKPVPTGYLNTGNDGGMQNWADLKQQAEDYLGLKISDHEALDAPKIKTDLYGNFIPGDERGMPQIVLADGTTIEGNNAPGMAVITMQAERTGQPFLADISPFSVPGKIGMNCEEFPPGTLKQPDDDTIANSPFMPTPEKVAGCEYDDELLGTHYIAGDGRVNENIALTSVHHIFHSEHNRVVGHVQDQAAVLNGGELLAEFQNADGSWNGSRLFQAAKFVTEMEYQHLAFEEFARKIQPFVNGFTGYDTTVDAAIVAEFAHATYRFGHSMLTETVDRYNTATGTPMHTSLFEAFLNPPQFDLDGTLSHDEAAGGLLAGSIAQIGQEIDEFVTPALRNQLLGMPLDLAAINIARGRDAGIAPLNSVREMLWNNSNNDPSLKPYESWRDYQNNLRHQESLVNFIAAYGTHPLIATFDDGNGAGTLSSRRRAAEIIVNVPMSANYPADAEDFLWSSGAWAADETGLNDVDLWVGGLAEKPEIFGGLLGTTHNSVFEVQMERLQNGDRFYYLHRLAGTNLLAALEGNSFSELIERNTTATRLPADVFSHPTFRFDLTVVNPSDSMPLVDDPNTPWDETMELVKTPAGKVWYQGADHALFFGREIADNIQSGEGDDTVKGNGGNDVLEGEGGNDVLVGGEGNDILTDTFGDDDLKGGPGSDTIHGGAGFDLLQGGTGDDVVFIGSDMSEIFGGSGNDIFGGGADADTFFGDEGDDWIEGGEGADLVQGDNGALFDNNPNGTDGHDVLDGGPGNDDYLAEGGDDIMRAGEGTEQFGGLLGFDCVTYVNSPQAASADLLRGKFLPVTIETNGDRFDLVECLSGGPLDDVLRGDDRGFGGGGENELPALCEVVAICGDLVGHELTPEGVARIDGIEAILDGATSYDEGNILLGGGGSDIIEPRGGNDIIDGDRYLEVKLLAPNPEGLMGETMEVDSVSELSGYLLNGQMFGEDISIVRRVAMPAAAGVVADNDVVVFGAPMDQYNITKFEDHVKVDHKRGCGAPAGDCPAELADPVTLKLPGDDGLNVLYNIETLRFSDQDVSTAVMDARGMLRVTTAPALGAQISLNGVPMDSWGLSWVEVPLGVREVCFSDMEGWTAPGCVTAEILEGQTSVVEGSYAQRGWLRVTAVGLYDANPGDNFPAISNPVPATISVDGIPMNDWGMWTDLDVGEYEVCFGAVEFYTAPACELLTVVAGETTEFEAQYVSDGLTAAPTGHGQLRVATTPAVKTQISVDGVIRNTWSLDWVKIAPGLHEVCFSDVTAFSTPDCETVQVVAGQTTTVLGSFTERGWLQINTNPAVGSTITVNGLPRNAWGMWTHLDPGSYDVCFSDVDNYVTPDCLTVQVDAGQLTTHTQNFVATP